MTAEIHTLQCETKLDLPPERVLQGALKAELQVVVICGIDKDGKQYFASTSADSAETAFHLQRGIWKLCEWAERDE